MKREALDRKNQLPTSGPPWIRFKYPSFVGKGEEKFQKFSLRILKLPSLTHPKPIAVHKILPRISCHQVTLFLVVEILSDRLLFKNAEVNFICFIFFLSI